MTEYTSEMAGIGQYGICKRCKQGPTKDGHDGCLGTLPGSIMNACCGHGDNGQAYIQYWGEDGGSGDIISGVYARYEQLRLIYNRTTGDDFIRQQVKIEVCANCYLCFNRELDECPVCHKNNDNKSRTSKTEGVDL